MDNNKEGFQVFAWNYSLVLPRNTKIGQSVGHTWDFLCGLGWILDNIIYTSGYVFNLFGGAISWMRKRQVVVVLSTTEAEYMAATHARKEVVWLQTLCSGIGLVQKDVRIDCDSQSEIFLAKNPDYHSKTKHINIQYHFVRDMVEKKKVLLMKVDTFINNTFFFSTMSLTK